MSEFYKDYCFSKEKYTEKQISKVKDKLYRKSFSPITLCYKIVTLDKQRREIHANYYFHTLTSFVSFLDFMLP